MIKSFACRQTEALFSNQRHRGIPPKLQTSALRKLRLIDAADSVYYLRLPPRNTLQQLTGNRHNQHSIRINQQYRICFRFIGQDACDVEIVDYH